MLEDFLRGLFSDGSRALKKAVTGKDKYFGEAQIRLQDKTFENSSLKFKQLMFRGLLGNTDEINTSYVLSALDVTDGYKQAKPVLSLVDSAQEEDTACFQLKGKIGRVTPGSALTDWVQMGGICPDLISTPYSGTRKICLILRTFDTSNPPDIRLGYGRENMDGVILTKSLEFEYLFSDTGYKEAAENKEESQAIALKIGVAVAMADGSLDDTEGEVLKEWIKKEISIFSDKEKDDLKNLFNESLRVGFKEAKEGVLSLSKLTSRLSEIGDKKSKYDALELCFEIMAADGIADPEEMKVIRNVAKSLNLDMEEIEKMREKVTLNLSQDLTSEEGLESLVGLDLSWSDEQKRKHLRKEFQKWSNRLNSLKEGGEREAAQNMLDNIATLRKKYG